MNINERISTIANSIEASQGHKIIEETEKIFHELIKLKDFLPAGDVKVWPALEEMRINFRDPDNFSWVNISLKDRKVEHRYCNSEKDEEVLTILRCLHGLYKDYEMYL